MMAMFEDPSDDKTIATFMILLQGAELVVKGSSCTSGGRQVFSWSYVLCIYTSCWSKSERHQRPKVAKTIYSIVHKRHHHHHHHNCPDNMAAARG